MKEYYLIGEVAKIFNISTDTLRYYDKIGLIKPEKISEKSYRYYHINQFDRLYMILLFKAINMPLEKISENLDIKDIDSFINLLDDEEEKIEEYIQELLSLKFGVSELKKKALYLKEDDEICIKRRPPMWQVLEEIDESQEFDLYRLVEVNRKINKDWTAFAEFIFTIDKEAFAKYDIKYNAFGLISEYKPDKMNAKLTYLESASCIYSIYCDSYDKIYKRYYEIMDFIYKNKIQISGDIIERSILSIKGEHDESKSVIEIWVPIKE